MSEFSHDNKIKNELAKLKLSDNQKEQLVGELDILSNLIIDSYLEECKKEKK